MNGIYLQTGQLYAPVRGADGRIKAFQEVQPIMARERETAYLADPGDAFALYRRDTSVPEDSPDYVPLEYLRQSGASPLDGNYNLIHVVQIKPGGDFHATLDACRAVDTLRPGDIAVFKQDGVLTCWYVELNAYAKQRGLLENCLKAAAMGTKQNANQIDPKRNVEQVIAGMRKETVHEITKEGASLNAQLAWYWTYIGSLDMAFMLGLIDDTRRQELYGEIKPFAPKNYLIAAETDLEQNHNQIDGIINNEAPKPAALEYEDEALYLVGGTIYLHVQTSEDNRSYTRDDCYTVYDYTLYDKATMRQLDGGQMEIVEDARVDPRQNFRMAVENILECMTALGGAVIEPVSMDILEALQDAAMREMQAAAGRITNNMPDKPSVRDSLKQCQKEVSAQGDTPSSKPRRDPER